MLDSIIGIRGSAVAVLKSPKRVHSPKGFSLIELLVAVAIVSVLVAIAIPQFALYRSRSADTQMKSDLKNAATAMESYFAEYRVYPSTVTQIAAVGFRQTAEVTLAINVTSPTAYTLTASHPSGTQASFTYDSSTGLIN
jgi:prepilin-type N-terminal cleavage/methylation domain-containing protein